MNLNGNINISLEKIKDTTKHIHNGIEFLLVVKGNLKIEKGGDVYLLKPNDVILINDRDVHSVASNFDNLAIILHINNEFLEKNCNDILTKKYICNSALQEEQDHNQDKFKFIRQSLTQIMLLFFKKDAGYDLQIMSKIYLLMNHIILNFQKSEDGYTLQIKDTDDRMDRILSYINNNYKEDITLKQLADDEYLSIHYLSKLFKEKTGVNFSNYLTELRMDNALKELIGSNIPINKIALNSGFTSIQSFNREFKKRFNEIPSEYRKKNKITSDDISPKVDIILPKEDNNLSELLKFIMLNDPILPESDVLIPNVEIDFKAPFEVNAKKGGRIIRIGRFNELNNHIIRKQLSEVCNEINFEYIHFEKFFLEEDKSFKDNILLEFEELINSLDFIRSLNLKPIVRIDIDYYIKKIKVDSGEILGRLKTDICKKLDTIVTQYGVKYLRSWHFEINGTILNENFNILEGIKDIFKSYDDSIKMGISIGEALSYGGFNIDLLAMCRDKNMTLDFVSFESDPNKEDFSHQIDDTNQNIFQDYLRKQIHWLKGTLDKYNFHDTLIFVTNFNTLGGAGFQLAGSFFRAALILKTITSITEPYVSLSFWISNQPYENISMSLSSNYRILSLFLLNLTKRPVYFVLKLIDKAGNNLSSINKNISVNTRGKNYYIIVSNQFYYNPLYSIEENYIHINRKNINATVKGIEPGDYLIKKYSLDKENGGQFDSILNMMDMKIMDSEILYQSEMTNCPSISIYERRITDTFNLNVIIPSNAVFLYEIKQISQKTKIN